MVMNDVSFILSFVILMAKLWIFGFSPRVCPTELCNLVFSLKYLVSNEIQALLWGIRLCGSATVFHVKISYPLCLIHCSSSFILPIVSNGSHFYEVTLCLLLNWFQYLEPGVEHPGVGGEAAPDVRASSAQAQARRRSSARHPHVHLPAAGRMDPTACQI